MGILSTERLLQYLIRLMVILLINPLHECAHAFAAYKLGDNTAKDKGRMTLSPLAHIDIFGALLLFFYGFGWAKPVPVNPMNFKKRRLGMMITAAAGPLTNLAAAYIGMVVMRMIGAPVTETMSYVYVMLYYFVFINISLCLFNLIPVPPLDGSRILSFFLPPRAELFMMRNQAYFYAAVMVLMVTGILSTPLGFLCELVYRLLGLLTLWVPVVM